MRSGTVEIAASKLTATRSSYCTLQFVTHSTTLIQDGSPLVTHTHTQHATATSTVFVQRRRMRSQLECRESRLQQPSYLRPACSSSPDDDPPRRCYMDEWTYTYGVERLQWIGVIAAYLFSLLSFFSQVQPSATVIARTSRTLNLVSVEEYRTQRFRFMMSVVSQAQ